MSIRVAVVGASGYTGGELLRLVVGHPGMELTQAVAGANAGESVTSIHPQLPTLCDMTMDSIDQLDYNELDLVFFALPHGQSGAVTESIPAHVKVVDLGADHRLESSSLWQEYYGTSTEYPKYAGAWTYGLPELPNKRAVIAASTRVANPGCYATATQLALAPVLADDLISGSDIVIVAAGGTSGAGRKATIGLSASEVMGSMSPYKIGGTHQHTPEIEQELSGIAAEPVGISFTPMLAPMPRGILAVCTAQTTRDGSADSLYEALHASYDDEPFVTVLPRGSLPTTAATLGSNLAMLQSAYDAKSGRATIVCAIDNLGKGAAGQAIQNANLMFGLDETSGLAVAGIAP